MARSLPCLLLLAGPLLGQQLPEGAPKALTLIRKQGLEAHARFLASDELGGRYTGTPGQLEAAEYIAAHFEKLGLEPLGDKRGFMQRYPLGYTGLDPKQTSIRIGSKTHKTGFAVIPAKDSKRVRVQGSYAFCGTGAPADIPKGLARRIPVVVLRSSARGPRANMRGLRPLQRAGQVARVLARQGARLAVFLILKEGSNVMDAMNSRALLPGKPHLRYGKKGRGPAHMPIPCMFLAPKPAQTLLKSFGLSPDLESFTGLRLKKAPRGRVQIALKENKRFTAVNVCALLRGEGNPKQAIVYSAHMDHMGTRMDGDAFNGADDNASGSAGLLTLAEAYAKAETRPKRSIIFLSVSGEELGLWGSHYYSENPTWPKQQIVANINIDMIGRHTDLSPKGKVSATPSPAHAKFSTLVQDAAGFAAKLGMSLSSGDTYYLRSDHYNFARLGIPVVFFCDGEHGDYHKVSDHADKLDYDKMERITRLAFWTGWAVAQSPRRPRELGKRNGWLK